MPQEQPLTASPPALVSAMVAAHHPAVRSSLCGVLGRDARFGPLMAAADIRHAIRLLRSSAPDVVLVDWALLGEPGLRQISTLAAAAPRVAFLVVGMSEHSAYEDRAREAGAAGYLRLDQAADELTATVVRAASARHH